MKVAFTLRYYLALVKQLMNFYLIKVLGHKEGLNVMEKADPLFLLLGLPTIPVMLILGKMVRWEDYILRLWRKHSPKLPLLSYFWPDGMLHVELY